MDFKRSSIIENGERSNTSNSSASCSSSNETLYYHKTDFMLPLLRKDLSFNFFETCCSLKILKANSSVSAVAAKTTDSTKAAKEDKSNSRQKELPWSRNDDEPIWTCAILLPQALPTFPRSLPKTKTEETHVKIVDSNEETFLLPAFFSTSQEPSEQNNVVETLHMNIPTSSGKKRVEVLSPYKTIRHDALFLPLPLVTEITQNYYRFGRKFREAKNWEQKSQARMKSLRKQCIRLQAKQSVEVDTFQKQALAKRIADLDAEEKAEIRALKKVSEMVDYKKKNLDCFKILFDSLFHEQCPEEIDEVVAGLMHLPNFSDFLKSVGRTSTTLQQTVTFPSQPICLSTSEIGGSTNNIAERKQFVLLQTPTKSILRTTPTVRPSTSNERTGTSGINNRVKFTDHSQFQVEFFVPDLEASGVKSPEDRRQLKNPGNKIHKKGEMTWCDLSAALKAQGRRRNRALTFLSSAALDDIAKCFNDGNIDPKNIDEALTILEAGGGFLSNPACKVKFICRHGKPLKKCRTLLKLLGLIPNENDNEPCLFPTCIGLSLFKK